MLSRVATRLTDSNAGMTTVELEVAGMRLVVQKFSVERDSAGHVVQSVSTVQGNVGMRHIALFFGQFGRVVGLVTGKDGNNVATGETDVVDRFEALGDTSLTACQGAAMIAWQNTIAQGRTRKSHIGTHLRKLQLVAQDLIFVAARFEHVRDALLAVAAFLVAILGAFVLAIIEYSLAVLEAGGMWQ